MRFGKRIIRSLIPIIRFSLITLSTFLRTIPWAGRVTTAALPVLQECEDQSYIVLAEDAVDRHQFHQSTREGDLHRQRRLDKRRQGMTECGDHGRIVADERSRCQELRFHIVLQRIEFEFLSMRIASHRIVRFAFLFGICQASTDKIGADFDVDLMEQRSSLDELRCCVIPYDAPPPGPGRNRIAGKSDCGGRLRSLGPPSHPLLKNSTRHYQTIPLCKKLTRSCRDWYSRRHFGEDFFEESVWCGEKGIEGSNGALGDFEPVSIGHVFFKERLNESTGDVLRGICIERLGRNRTKHTANV